MNLHELAKETAERISAIAYCPIDDNAAEVPIEEATKLIESALLDARKQGMTDAAEMVRSQGFHSDFNFRMPDAERMMADKIIEASDRLELKGQKP